MGHIEQLEVRRHEVLQQLAAIRSLRKGCLNEQWFPVVRNGRKTGQLRGPYYVWSCKVDNKTVSERLNGHDAVKQARQDAENYRRFRLLCAELEELTARIGRLERPTAAAKEALKKKLTSRLNRASK
jgi:hypothetical protein